jgi:hypothetical protein
MKIIKTLAYILGGVVVYLGFLVSICFGAINFGTANLMWSKVPAGFNLNTIGWNLVLTYNVVSALLLGSFLFFVMLTGGHPSTLLPRRFRR